MSDGTKERCKMCGDLFPERKWDGYNDVCEECQEQLEAFSGDYNELHPDETEEEFDEHECLD